MKVTFEFDNFDEFVKFIKSLDQSSYQPIAPEADVTEETQPEPGTQEAMPSVEQPEPAEENNILAHPVQELPLPERLIETLDSHGIRTLADLTHNREKDLRKVQGVGIASVRQIRKALSTRGLRLRRSDYKGYNEQRRN